MKRVAINGFGRIGRMVFRLLTKESDIEVVAINARYTAEQLGHLIMYDTVHGQFDGDVVASNGNLLVNGREVLLVNERNPRDLPWGELDIDVVVEATGAFRTVEGNEGHLQAGAKKVVVTAPAKDDMKMIVMGVNEETYQGETIISNASCTTNCLAPIMKALDESFGVESGLMTTIHSITNDQKNIDNPHKDLRRARAGGHNMIPTSTGAARAIGEVLPTLAGKLNGLAVRVPTLDVSLVDVVVDVKTPVTKEAVNAMFATYANNSNGVLAYNELPLVSSDYITSPQSATVDGLSTMVLGDTKVKILAWYDNEWGYSARVVDLVNYI